LDYERWSMGKDKGNSRSPSGMTTRKARVRKARATADPLGDDNRKSEGTRKARATADPLRG
jgi:hypothetical protein